MAGDAGSIISGDSVGNVYTANTRLSTVSSPPGDSDMGSTPAGDATLCQRGGAGSSGGGGAGLTEDEVRGIRLAEITIDT